MRTKYDDRKENDDLEAMGMRTKYDDRKTTDNQLSGGGMRIQQHGNNTENGDRYRGNDEDEDEAEAINRFTEERVMIGNKAESEDDDEDPHRIRGKGRDKF